MSRLIPACLLVLTFLLASCEKEDGEQGYRAAGITFRSGTGLTHENDTVGVGDTLHIEALVAEGSEQLRTIYAQRSIENGDWVDQDSIDFTSNPTTFPFIAIMGDAPRTERWSVLAVERNGDSTRRSLVFTVTE